MRLRRAWGWVEVDVSQWGDRQRAVAGIPQGVGAHDLDTDGRARGLGRAGGFEGDVGQALGQAFEPRLVLLHHTTGGDADDGADHGDWTDMAREPHNLQAGPRPVSVWFTDRVKIATMNVSPPVPTVRTVEALRAMVADWRRQGLSVGFVPTMGALHDGHLSLVREAVARADRVVASLFVNPTQFAPHEDLARYPRQEARDAALLGQVGCHLLYAPSAEVMYREDATTSIAVGAPAEGLEGEARPQMFGGVALVVCKLFNQVQPDIAVFGEKDWQQLAVVRRMVRDLDMAVEIIGVPTVRDGHGLALSSRNAYLSEAELAVARRLNGVLAETAAAVRAGQAIDRAEAEASRALIAAGFTSVDYVAIRRPDLTPLAEGPEGQGRILAAAWLGTTRLIDNLAI